MSFIPSKKGISPIIATILLLMMAVAIAGSAFFWISRMQNQMQGGVESYQSSLTTQMSSQVSVVGIEAGCATTPRCQNITIYFQNTGNTRIPLTNNSAYPTTTWILKDDNQITRCATNWNNLTNGAQCISGCGSNEYIDVGETKQVILDLSSPSPCSISTTGLTGSTNDRGKSFSFTVDFSGKTTASSSFIVPLA